MAEDKLSEREKGKSTEVQPDTIRKRSAPYYRPPKKYGKKAKDAELDLAARIREKYFGQEEGTVVYNLSDVIDVVDKGPAEAEDQLSSVTIPGTRKQSGSQLVDPEGKPLEVSDESYVRYVNRVQGNELVTISISQDDFDRLNAKTREILAESGLARVRISKDQEESDLLKTETREALRRLRAV